MHKGTLVLILAGAVGGWSAQEQTIVRGTVYVDVNENGRREAGEPGLPDVIVSNQHSVTRTTADGAFRLDDVGTGIVFVSQPDGYRVAGAFWRRVDDGAGQPVAFGLVAVPLVTDFAFVHASDPHVQASTLGRLERVLVMADSAAAAFVVVSGDLVHDALRVQEAEARSYYEMYRDAVAMFAAPVWSSMGNHEYFGIERHSSLVSRNHPLYGRRMYRHYLGPDYYSFNYGGIHFVALNTVDVDDTWYHGGVDSTQLQWLAADIAAVPSDMPVVTFNHIPFFSTSAVIRGYDGNPPAPTLIRVRDRTQFRHTVANARDVLAILWSRPYPLALGGHVHLRERIRYGLDRQETRFEQAAAVVGGWNDGVIGAQSGVTVYRVRGGVIGPGTFLPLDPMR